MNLNDKIDKLWNDWLGNKIMTHDLFEGICKAQNQAVQELKEKCKKKWDDGNFVLANVNEFIDEIFGPKLTGSVGG